MTINSSRGSLRSSIASGDLETAANTTEDILATEADNIPVLMLKGKIQTLNKKYEDAIEYV